VDFPMFCSANFDESKFSLISLVDGAKQISQTERIQTTIFFFIQLL